MTPGPDVILPPQTITCTVALEPAYNALASLWMLDKAREFSGLGEWVIQTASSLTPVQAHTNRLIFEGLYDVVVIFEPGTRWAQFSEYVERLASSDPVRLRDRALIRLICRTIPCDNRGLPVSNTEAPAPALLLADRVAYLDLIQRAMPGQQIDIDLHAEAHGLLNDPPTMMDLVVTHLRALWQDHLAVEWDRQLPLLHEVVDASQRFNYLDMTVLEAIRAVTGRELTAIPSPTYMQTVQRLIFLPSAHIGPYLVFFYSDGVAYIVFGVRTPEGTPIASAALSRAQLMNQLNALADDTRLHILELVGERGEMFAQDIILSLDLSQSSASRHLRQLTAAGFLSERRRDGANKVYSLNIDCLEEMIRSLSTLLLGK